ncbi:MDR family MFS transporter [Ktedonosporobacter rubrisoli]|uniref:MDR family MFS transporter n=1 Tax=Ktedonosporobacter rubrisoli TaxID=2509675 RepID=UPI0013EECD91|nr:MDR family MFS transporter [Ktedonosporobacter rubrisoli]
MQERLAERKGIPYRWQVLMAVTIGTFMSLLDQTVVNIAIPRLQSAFGVDIQSVQLVITTYLLTAGIAIAAVVFCADRFGIKRVYILSLVLFTLSSALCGLSWNFPLLVCFRIVQGIGAAALFPLATTFLLREFPAKERGLMMGIFGIPVLLAPALGPTLGGYLVTYADWPAIFYINVPLGILAIILCSKILREVKPESHLRFDLVGFILIAVGIGLVLYALAETSTAGWGSPRILTLLLGGGIALIIFSVFEVRRERRGVLPLLYLSLFRNGPFLFSILTTMLLFFRFMGSNLLFPLYLQQIRGETALQAGLILIAQPIASAVTSLLGGKFVDLLGVKLVVIAGLILLIIASWQLTFISTTAALWWLLLWLIVQGLSFGLCVQPLVISANSEIVPQRIAQANAFITLARSVSASLGVAIVASVLQMQSQLYLKQATGLANVTKTLSTHLLQRSAILAQQDAFWVLLIISILALLTACFVQRGTFKNTVQSLSAGEQEEGEAVRNVVEK